jgi:F-type H+-transporting ATPase subunit delta
MKFSEVSRRYAKALYEITKANNSSNKVFDELRAFRNAIESDRTIREFICSPSAPIEAKKEILTKTLTNKFSNETLNVLLLLNEKSRLYLFDEVVSAFESISDEDHGVTRGTVRSANALSTEARKKIEETNKKVILSFTEDPKLLGGMVASVAGWSFDDSLDFHLSKLSEELNRRAN